MIRRRKSPGERGAVAKARASIFISYRRKVAGGHAEGFQAAAGARYGRSRVFRDVESINPGEDWAARLDDELQRSKVVVAIIAPGWAGGDGPDARIWDANDPVRYELNRGHDLSREVVPLLMGGMQEADLPALPADLDWLRACQMVEVVPGQESSGYKIAFRKTIDQDLGWWALRRNRTLAGVVGAVVVAVLVAAAIVWPRPTLPTFTESDSGLLFVPATEQRPGGELTTSDAADSFTARLASGLQTIARSGVYLVADPAFAVTATSTNERQRAVLDLLAASNADVVLTGTLERSVTASDFEPEVYLGSMLDAEDLAGEQIEVDTRALRGVDVDIDVVPAASQILADQAVAAIAPVATLLDAIAAYERRDLEKASDQLTTLLDGDGVVDPRSRAVLSHLRGNARAELGDLDGARQDYEQALVLRPGFERSALGLAEIELTTASGASCANPFTILAWSPSMDPQRLSDAEQAYRQLQGSTSDPVVRAKATVGLARVDACRVQAFADIDGIRIPSARRAYQGLDEVLAQGETSRSPAMAETLAIAYLTRATLTIDLDDAEPAHETRQAADDLSAVSGLTRRPWLKGEAQLVLGDLLSRQPSLGDAQPAYAQACAALQRTIDLGPGSTIEQSTRQRMAHLTANGVECA